jgi:dihydroorotase
LTRNLVDQAAGIQPLHLARKAADDVGLPVMVHPNDAWSDSIDDILSVMRTGDILTHCYHGYGCGILDSDGKVRNTVLEARERGILFDVGHGRGSFKWEVVDQAFEQDLLPQTISSDLHVYSLNGPVFDLATTMSKFLHLGLSLDQVIERVTQNPAEAMGMSGQIGALKVGVCGDAVVFNVEQGEFDFYDAHDQCRVGKQRIVPATVVRAGSVYG